MTSLIVLGVLCGAILALYLLLNGTKAPSAVYFRYTLLANLCWTLSIFFTELDKDPLRVLIWSRLSFVFPMFIIISLLPFSLEFGRDARHKISGRMLWSSVVIGAISLGLALVSISTPLVLQSVVNLTSTFGPVQPYYGIFLLASFVYVIGLLVVHRSRAKSSTAEQLNIIILGILLSAVMAITTNLVVPYLGLGEIRFLGPLSLVFFLGATTYAILAHHLFDIRVVIKRTVIFAVLVAFAFAVYAIVISLVSRIFQRETLDSTSFFTNLAAMLLVGFSFEPLRSWISERTDKWLFKKEYEQQVVVRDLSKKLNDVIGLDDALEIVMQTIVKVLHLKHAVTYVFQPGESSSFAVKRVKQVGYSSTARLILDEDDFTVSYFTQHGSVTQMRDIQLELEREKLLLKKSSDSQFVREHAIKQAVYKKLCSLDAAVAIPLHLNTQPIGLILFSEKLNGEGFRAEDLALLDLVGGQAISSIQKAKLYEGDQMKSEFVSIASHELLTPISAIEGYLSMILEENIGKVDPQARDYLTKVYTSAKRLSLLIKDLLSVSRIESGKMKIEPQQLDITKMISDTVDQLRFMASNKGLTIETPKPGSEPPPVWADPDRTMQVMVNLVSNAIKYTPKGKVTITTEVDKKAGFLRVDVKDTGLGMSKAQMQHLFTRFYRVDTPETTGIVGTGLGLYITKSIVEKMGGSITCTSTAGKGSMFSVSLPLFKVETSSLS
jgi:signal transduction histidine kinase